MSDNTNVTLEDFIKKYNESKKKSQKTYSEWLSEQGDMTEINYSDAIKDAQIEYDRARSGYGRTGELLSQKGLNGSGYASFLDSNAYSELQNSKREAEKKKNAAQIKNKSAYASYLQDLDSAQSKLTEDAISNIYKYGASDYDTSYKLAILSGLDEETAKHVADLSVAIGVGNKKISVSTKRALLSELMRKRLTGDKAKAFLTACGLSEEEAEDISEAAEEAIYGNSSSSDLSFFN